jgi:hypothetical protein
VVLGYARLALSPDDDSEPTVELDQITSPPRCHPRASAAERIHAARRPVILTGVAPPIPVGLHVSLPILAADLGKYKSVFCRFDPATGVAKFRTVATTPDAFREAFAREPVQCVAFELGTPAGWVRDLATDMGITVGVANTTAEPWRWKNVKRKTDRDVAQE